ncbi:MAG: hypothetical protein VKO39_11670 [Cyanobacteriota bacterium]|nr:hypothetical protein [Cyanobacteriota bacterium]
MATAPSPTSASRRQARPAPSPPRWRRWLFLGVCFGLGYGLTQRLLDVRWEDDSNRPPAFRTKAPAGGLSLEQLRRQHGAEPTKPLAADLDTLAREKRVEEQKQAAAKREEAARLKAAQQQETEDLENERRRLEELNRPVEPAASEPIQPQDAPLLTPPSPTLPPPEPATGQPTPTPPSQPAAEAPTSQP